MQSIDGSNADDHLGGTWGADRIDGKDGNDYLYGEYGDDLLIGGKGQDSLHGGSGNDIYSFNRGDGRDVIGEWGHDPTTVDCIVFGSSIAPADLLVRKLGLHLQIDILGTQDGIVVQGYFDSHMSYRTPRDHPVDLIQFADGTVWNREAIHMQAALHGAPVQQLPEGDDFWYGHDNVDGGAGNDELHVQGGNYVAGGSGDDVLRSGSTADQVGALLGGAGNDRITGGKGDDIIVGGTGNDELDGYAGLNTYIFTRGWGQDRLRAEQVDPYTPGRHDIVFTDVLASAVVVTRADGGAGNDLIIAVRGTNDSVRILDFFTQTAMTSVTFADGKVWQRPDMEEALHRPAPVELVGTDGADYLYGGWGDDVILGGAGDDTLHGAGGNDLMSGGSGADFMAGGEGEDTYIPGSGRSQIDLGEGGDTVLVGRDTGHVMLNSWGARASVIVMAGDVLPGDVSVKPMGQYRVSVQINGSAAMLEMELRSDPYGFGFPAQISFADGTRWDSDALLAKLLAGDEYGNIILGYEERGDRIDGKGGNDHLDGRRGDDVLQGGDGDDVLIGGDGDDRLDGGSGSDRFDGGAGNDVFQGGLGNDMYMPGPGHDVVVFNRGDGQDVIGWHGLFDLPSSTVLRLGAGIVPNEVQLRMFSSNEWQSLIVEIGSGSDVVHIPEFHWNGNDQYRIHAIEFADGTVWNLATILAAGHVGTEMDDTLHGTQGAETLDGRGGNDILIGEGGNDTLLGGSGDDHIKGGQGNDLIVGGSGYNMLAGGEGADVYHFARTDGVSIIDDWRDHTGLDNVLRFGEGITPDQLRIAAVGSELHIYFGDVGQVKLINGTNSFSRVEFADGSVRTLETLMQHAPTVVASAADQDVKEGSAFVATLPRFIDVDREYFLRFAVTQADGSALPSWMSFDPVSHRLSGMPGYESAGTYAIKVTATDKGGLSADSTFNVIVANVNRAPELVNAIPAQTLAIDQPFSLNVPVATFIDPDAGDTGTYHAVSLPAWLSFDSANQKFVGMPGREDVGTYEVTLVYTDAVGASASTALVFTVSPPPSLTINGTAGADVLTGKTGNDALNGFAGNDTLDGGAGADQMAGGTGDDIYVVDNAGDAVIEANAQGTDSVNASISHTLSANVEKLTLTGNSAINGTGNSLANTITGNGAANRIDGGQGADAMVGGAGNDIYFIDHLGDVVTEGANGGFDQVFSLVTRTLPSSVEVLRLDGAEAINGTGNAASNLVIGNGAANVLGGHIGYDIMQAGAGNDTLTDNSSQANVFDGGAGDDSMTGGAANELFIGGTGNDTIDAKSGRDIIAFNKGDGHDIVTSFGGGDNTLSLGRVAYADLALSKVGTALVLRVGASDQITFKGWYDAGGASVAKLQVVLQGGPDHAPGSSSAINDQQVELFNFAALVNRFNAALGANPSIESWNMAGAMAGSATGGSDTAAIGGDLTYQYALHGDLANVGFTPALTLIGNTGFGNGLQTLLGGALVDGLSMLL